uniref:Vitellogenin n=1 Tax=Setaria digitata TaxID=48799 RepID=A0A915PUL0_9BILA
MPVVITALVDTCREHQDSYQTIMCPEWLLLLQAVITWTVAQNDKRQAVPTDACAKVCTGVSSEVKYDVGRSYVFDVTSRTILKIGHERDTDVAQTAQAHISVHSPCEFSLKLTRTSLRGMDVASDWSDILERSSLRFAFDDGEVKAVCPHEDDPTWAVNIKRAILSAFQIKHEGPRETDISGDCPVVIEKRKSNDVLNLKTTKKLNECYREHDVTGVRAIPYRLKAKMQAVPIMETKQTCERQIANYNLQQVTCTENYHVTSPFDEGKLGTLHVEQRLQAVGIARVASQEPFKERLSIVFDHTDDNFYLKSSPQFAKRIINELCQTNDRVAPDAASHFADLVYNLRGLSAEDLSSISNFQCDAFVDALAACASNACLMQLANLINSEASSESIYSSLSLLPNPKIGTMNSIAAFIERVPIHGLLAVSSLVQSYCIAHPMCGKEPTVQRVIDVILSKLPPGCHVGEQFEEIKKAVIALKSIGNIGYEKQSLAAILNCITGDRVAKEVKLAAIDALRRKPCSQQRNAKITELFRDRKEDVQVRIASFRQLMECPNDEILQIIIDQLHNETINQVGSYVWSYLNTKQRSTNPSSSNLQHILKRFHIPHHYNLDPNRFSRYYELGYFDRENNYGGHMDTSVLLVPNGYIPREVKLNFTVHLFGKSVNILEIGTQAVGLEQAEEELFGPDGYISNPNGHVFREKTFHSRYPKLNQLKQLYSRRKNAVEDRITTTFYVRMFGDDLHYYAFQTNQNQLLSEIKENIEINQMLAKLVQENTKKLSRHMLLFELSQTFPTLSGLSLQFLVNVSVAAKIDSKLRLNLVNLLKRRGDANGHIDLRPSLSLARGGAVLLRAGQVASGALVTSNLHAATSIVSSMEMSDGRRLSLTIGVPHNDLLVAQMRIGLDSYKIQQRHYCSADTLAKIFGIRGCIDFKANFPIIEGSLKVEKNDRRLSSYQFFIERFSARGEQKLLISMDTPGSEVNRKMEANFEISIPQRKLKIGVITPFKTIVLDGNLQQMQRTEEYATNLKLMVDNNVYILDGILKTDKAGPLNLYKLNARSIVESLPVAEIAAELQYDIVKPYAMVDFHLEKVFGKPIVFRTLINPEAPKYEGKLEYSGPDFNGKLIASIIRRGLKKGTNYHFKHAVRVVGNTFNELNFQILSDHAGNSMKNLLEATYLGKKSMANLDVTRGSNHMYTAVGMVKFQELGIDTRANIIYQNRFPLQFTLKIDAETPDAREFHLSAEYVVKTNPKWNFNGNILLKYLGRKIVFKKRIDEVTIGQYKMETYLQWDQNKRIDAISQVVFRPRENEYTIESTANVAGIAEPISIKKHIKYQTDNYNIQWEAKQGGRTIYELNGNLEGEFGNQQRFSVKINSEKFEPRVNYQLTAEVQPSADSIKTHAKIYKDGRFFGTCDITVPKKFNLPNQQYRGEFNWNYQDRSRKVAVEYNQLKHTNGLSHAVKVQSDGGNLNVQLDHHHDKMILKCDFEKDRIRSVSATLRATPFRWNFFEIDGSLYTDRPFQQRSIKTKAAFIYRTEQVNAEGMLEVNNDRYAVEGHWQKTLRDISRHYTYGGKLETPQTQISLSQQLEVEKAITIRKAKTVLILVGASRTYNLTSEIKTDDISFSTATDVTGTGIILKHTVEYNHKDGQRRLKKYLKYNEKEVNADAATVYRDGEVKVDFGLSTTFEAIRYGKIMFNCRKGAVFWNCDAESNLNNRYIIRGHESLSPQNTDLGYWLKLGNVVDNEGKIKFDIDNRASKYNANSMLRSAGNKYIFEMDINGDKGFMKFQTPTYAINHLQIKVLRKGPTEFEFHGEGETRGKVYAHVKTGDNDKLFVIQMTEVPEPFKLHLENSLIGYKQKSVAELILDPLGQKKTYGLENEVESDGRTFRAMRSTLKQPKRKINIELLRPDPSKYSLSVQPNVGGTRRPTVAEMTYHKTSDGYQWEGSISDDALQKPLKAKVIYKKDERDKNNYRLDLQTELDYSGQPEKLFSNSLHLHRSVVSSDGRKLTTKIYSKSNTVRFIAELKSMHPASNLNTRLWVKVDRREIEKVMIPVHATFGLRTTNLQRHPVEYSLETKTDAAGFAEAQLKSPDLMLKTRIDRIKDNHYTVGFYKNNAQPSVIGELNFQDSGPIFEYRDERSREVKLHASALMPNDHEGEVDVWHNEGGKKIQDVRVSLQVEESNVLKGKVYLRPAMEREIMKAKETSSIKDELRQSSFVRNALLPIFSSHTHIANDIMRTLDGVIKKWTSEQRSFAAELGSEYTELVDEIENNYEIIKEAILTAYDQFYQEVEQLVKALSSGNFVYRLQQLTSGTEEIRQEIVSVMKSLSDLIDQLNRELNVIQRNAAITIGHLEDTLMLKDLQRNVFYVSIYLYSALKEYKENFERTDIIQIVLYEIRKLTRQYRLPELERTIADIEVNRKRYGNEVVKIYKKIKDLLLDKVIVSALTKLTTTIFDPLDDIEIRQKWQEIINYLRGQITAKQMIERFWKKYVPKYKHFGAGEYELEVSVPHGASSLKEVLSNLHPHRLLALKSTLIESFGLSPHDKELAESLSETIYMYKSTRFNPWKMISSFESIAYIIDGDRFITFDGRVFAFHARCEYLLSTDLRTQRFALLAIFSSHGRFEAIKAELRGEELILYKNGNVRVSGAPISMPWQKIDSIDGAVLVSVYRKDRWTVLKTYDGLRVRCNSEYDICEIVLPGRMHGRSSGLLGVNDNEPSNDRDLIDGTPNDQLNALAEHWAISGACHINEARDLTHRDDDNCQTYFQSSSSPLRSCFSQIRPKPFEQICSSGGKQQHCAATSAYLQICLNTGIFTSLPHECVKCDNDLHLDDEKKIEKSVVEHDVVFVVEERKCLDNYKEKLMTMAQKISQEQRSVRFGWVGFGGEGVHHEPLVHYEQDEALFDVRTFIRQAQQTFEPVSGIGVSHGCPKKAVEFTGITMHLLTLSKFKTSDGSKIVGIDAKQLFDDRGAQVGQRTALQHPNDGCSIVAQQSSGTVFSLKHGSMAAVPKIVPRQESHCLNCQCTADSLFVRNICRPCEAVEPAELASYGMIDSAADNDPQLLDTFI